jgi:hypothetical protein
MVMKLPLLKKREALHDSQQKQLLRLVLAMKVNMSGTANFLAVTELLLDLEVQCQP